MQRVFSNGGIKAGLRGLVLIVAMVFASVPAVLGQNIEWIQQFGTPSHDSACGITADDTGVYVAGYAEGDLDGDGGPGTHVGYSDAFVRKYSLDGTTILWTQQFGTAGDDVADDITADATGVYVAGFTCGDLEGPGTYEGYNDGFVRKYDLDGNAIWTRQFGTTGRDRAIGITVDATGVYVAGYTEGDLEGTNAGYRDAFVRKYSLDGDTILWTQQFGTTDYDEAIGITADATGVYVAGDTAGDAFVRKYSLNGTILWTQQFGTTYDDAANGITADATGVYVAGHTRGDIEGPNAGVSDAFVRKYSLDGTTILWTQQFGTAGDDVAGRITADATGVYVAGYTEGDLEGTNAGYRDAFVRKYSLDGDTILWTQQFGTEYNDEAIGITADATGVYVAGDTADDLDGEGPGTHASVSGVSDAFLARIGDEPVTLDVVADPNPAPVNTAITLTATPSANMDAATYTIGNGAPVAMTAQNGSFSAVISGYAEAGVHTICVQATGSETVEECIFLAVHDPVGYVSGAGWINSPPGAYTPPGADTPDLNVAGKARFGFISKYQKGASVPTGHTHFRFRAADMSFSSDSYEWLVVADHKAMYRGVGTINRSGNYGFMLSAIDADLTPSTEDDLFRIKIWDKDNGDAVVYDNLLDENAPDNADPTTAIGGGKITIRTAKAAPPHSKFADKGAALPSVPMRFRLLANYPNPFNPETWLPYELAEDRSVTIRIYNASGRLVRLLDLGHKPAGFYTSREKSAYWDGRNESGESVSSGIYFYQIQAGEFSATRKMTILK